jgi:protocatechuate 3,4-dioxygenase, alpha subunit
MSDLKQTPSQTVGPYFTIGLIRPGERANELITDAPVRARISVEGVVYDGAGAPVPDAVIEIWQADASGRYVTDVTQAHPYFRFCGFGRCMTDADGAFAFSTVKPGFTVERERHAPHLNVAIFARGMLLHAFTRAYFDDDDHAADPVLATVDASRRATLIARRQPSPAASYRWNIHLQGDQETVFFDA